MFEWFWKAVGKAQHATVEHKEAVMMPSDRVVEDPFPELVDGRKFVSGGSYFGIRLAGMHVKDARQFGTELFPLFVSLAEFKQRGQSRTLPFSIGPHEFMDALKTAGAITDDKPPSGWIERRNVPVVPPTPVGVGNLSLFVGLYSVPGSDVVRTLLDVVGDLSKTAGTFMPTAAVAGPALDIARAVYTGFGSLVGLNSVQALVQAEDGRALPSTGSGYLVVANAPPGTLEREKMVVRDGKLCRDKTMVTDFDYCLVAVERYATVLEEASQIAPDLFDAEWTEVLQALAKDGPEAAKEPMRKLMAAVRGTPALIDSDRTAAMTAYLQRYTEELTLTVKVPDPTRGGSRPGDSAKPPNGPMAVLLTARDEHAKRRNDLAANKLSTVTELMEIAQRTPRAQQDRITLPGRAAGEIRKKLLEAGEGADDALADALLRAV